MSQAEFARFRHVVLADGFLQERLRSVTDHDTFSALVVELAAERGFALTTDDLTQAMRDGRRAWLERWIR